MADKEFTVQVKVKATSEDAAIEQVKKALNNLEKSTKEAGKAASSASGSFASAGKQLLAYAGSVFGVVKALQFLKQSFQAAAQEQAMWRVLEQGMLATGKATREQVQAMKEYLEKAEELSGFDKDDLIPGYLSLIEVTGNAETAQKLLTVAVTAAAHEHGNASEYIDVMTRTIMTGTNRALTPFGIKLREMAEDGKIANEEFKNLSNTYHDLGASIHDTEMEQRRAELAWQRTKETMGSTMQQVLTPLLPALKGVGIFVLMLAEGVLKLGLVWSKFMDIVTFGTSNTFKNAQVEIRKMMSNIEDGMANIMAMGTSTVLPGVKAIQKGFEEIHTGSSVKPKDIDVTLKELNEYKNLAEEIAEQLKDFTLPRQKGKSFEIFPIDEWESASKQYQELLKKDNEERQKQQAQDEKYQLAHRIAFLNSLVRIEKSHNRTIEGLDKELTLTTIKFYAMAAESILTSLNTILAAAGTRSKALFRIVQALSFTMAIMNSYEAFTKTLKESTLPFPMNMVMAYVVLGLGLAQAAVIASQKPPAAAKGALITQPTTLLAGEAGAELVLPAKYTEMFDKMAENKTYNYGGNVNLRVNALTGGYAVREAWKSLSKHQRLHGNRYVGGS